MSSVRITKYEMDTLKFNDGIRQQNIATTRQPRIDMKEQTSDRLVETMMSTRRFLIDFVYHA